MGQAAAHDPDVGRDHDRLESEPLEDPDVGAALRLVAGVEARLVAIAAVGILHHEFANADEPAARARLVPPLGLEVIDHHRQLTPGLDDVGQQQPDDLLVGHRQDHLAPVAILEPGQLGADRVVASAGLPDVGRMDDRHLHLLAADPVHLLADDLLDALVDTEAERQQRVDPRSELADIARPQQQAMRRHLRIGGVVAQAREEEVGQTHPRRIAGAAPRARQSRPVTRLVQRGRGRRRRARAIAGVGDAQRTGTPSWSGRSWLRACTLRAERGGQPAPAHDRGEVAADAVDLPRERRLPPRAGVAGTVAEAAEDEEGIQRQRPMRRRRWCLRRPADQREEILGQTGQPSTATSSPDHD